MLPQAEEGGLDDSGLMMRDGKLKSGYGPYRARDLFKIPLNREEGRIWTLDRMGISRTNLRDGRVVYIGGEHEDSYDPDFYIYNDVVVFHPSSQIEIYGYPEGIFPPTDFHTATLIGERIIVVGCVGYAGTRRPGHTPVYALDLAGYHFSKIETSGEMPGWISTHTAALNAQGLITIRGGETFEERGGKEKIIRNVEDYALDARSWVWSRLTNRNWCQYSIYQEDGGLFALERHPEPKVLLPDSVKYTVLPSQDWNCVQIMVKGVKVSMTVGVGNIEIIIEGKLPDELCERIAREVWANTEEEIQRRCVLERL